MGIIMHKNIAYGGGGISAIADASDVDLSSPADGQILEYDTSGQNPKWVNTSLATVAKTGAYSDLSGLPTIPTVNDGTLTIQKNGSNVATFTANQSGNSTANISVPTKTSDITNDSGFITEEDTEVESLPDTTPYLYRKSPAIGTRVMENALVGASIVKNQICPVRATSNTINDVTFTTDNNGGYTVSGTASARANYELGGSFNSNLLPNHAYLILVNSQKITLRDSYNGQFNTSGSIVKKASWSRVDLSLSVENGVSISPSEKVYPMIIDLTQMLGTTIADAAYTKEQSTAGSGIAWLKSQGFDFSKYIAYNTGELCSVNPSGKKVVGKNLCNKTNVVGGYIQTRDSTFVTAALTNSLSVYIKCFPNTTYTVSKKQGARFRIGYTTEFPQNGTKIYERANNDSGTKLTITTGNDAVYLVAFVWNANSDTVTSSVIVDSVQIEFGSSATTYEPYTAETHPISQSPLRGVPMLVNDAIVYDGDVRKSDGVIVRNFKRYDLGAIDWGYSSTDQVFWTLGLESTKLLIACGYVFKDISEVTNNATASQYLGNLECTYRHGSTNDRIYFKNTAYTDKTSFINAMSGVYMDIQLPTPTTESLPPFDNPQKSFVGGTEEWITDNDIPVGHQSEYKKLPPMFEDDYIQTVAERAENAASKVTPYLQIMDNNVTTDVNNYRIYFHSISTPYALVNKAEMLSHRFLFVELFYNHGTPTNRRIISSALIDPNSLDGYFYEIEISNNDTLDIESYPDTDEFAITLFTTGSYNDGDPTNYYLTIRLVD